MESNKSKLFVMAATAIISELVSDEGIRNLQKTYNLTLASRFNGACTACVTDTAKY